MIGRAVDLEGQSVAVISLGSLMSAGVKSWLTQNGADIDKVHLSKCRFRKCRERLHVARSQQLA